MLLIMTCHIETDPLSHPVVLLPASILFLFMQVWGLGAATPHFALEGHDRGVNCLDYYAGNSAVMIHVYTYVCVYEQLTKILAVRQPIELPYYCYLQCAVKSKH